MNKPPLALTVSIIVNLFLIGAIVGNLSWQRFGHRMIAAGSLRVAGAELPAEDGKAFRAAIREVRAGLVETITKSREAKARAAALLKAPQVDEAAVLDALQDARVADFSVREGIEKRAVAFALGLPADDRARLADAIDDRLQRAMEKAQ